MKQKSILIFIILLAIIVVGVVVMDVVKNRTDKRPENPFELDITHLQHVDQEFISHKETRNFQLNADSVGAIALYGNQLYVGYDKQVVLLTADGVITHQLSFDLTPRALAVLDNSYLVVGFINSMVITNLQLSEVVKTISFEPQSIITSVSAHNGIIAVADAANRQVLLLDGHLNRITSFEGKREEGNLHGFIIPSPCFDLAFNSEGELWVVNPGMHAIEQYDSNGKMKAFWDVSSFKIDGFSGCCNPAHIAIAPDGSFITSEKGIVRIKIHEPSGKFSSVVAAPALFVQDGRAPDVVVDSAMVVYALDYDKKIVRVFEPKK
jgi:hypothetical protein